MTAIGRTVRLFLVDGDSQAGIVKAEIINWTGRVLSAPRSRLADLFRREEAGRTGVYMLFGTSMEAGVRRDVYIGESDNVGKRVLQHSKDESKDFFERVCIITSSDLNLTKTQARFLESRLTGIAKVSGRANVFNANEPPEGQVPESDVADMEYFIEQLRIVLPVLGYDVLRERASERAVDLPGEGTANSGSPQSIELTLRSNREGIEAKALLVGDEIIVKAGSLARRNPEYALNQYEALREQLIEDGDLVEATNDNFLTFARDVAFASPSAASAVIYGRNDNGRTSWRVTATQERLKDFQNALAEAVLGSEAAE